MPRPVLALILTFLTATVLTSGCGYNRKSTPTSPSATTGTGSTSTSSSYVGTWSSAATVGTIAANTCGNLQWKIASQTATAISGDFSATCGALIVAGKGSGQLNGQDVSLAASGSVSGSGVQVCTFSLTAAGTIQGETLPLTYSGTICEGSVHGTETLHHGLAGTPIVINAPAAVSPSGNVIVGSTQPTLVVTNATRTGPAGPIAYRFQVTQDVAFASNVLAWQMPEQSNQTSLTVPQALSSGAAYFWRAQAYDGSTTGTWSAIQTFTTPTPTSTPRPASGDQLNMSSATIVNSPFDLASWPITSALEVVDIRPNGVAVQFSKKDGAGRWPDVTPPGWGGALQYTLGMCLTINGRWNCSAVVEFWYGLDASGGPPGDFATNWFYDPIRWTPMTGHQPAIGETIGFFVCAGDCRNNTRGDLSPVKERTTVVLVPMPGSSGGTFRF